MDADIEAADRELRRRAQHRQAVRAAARAAAAGGRRRRRVRGAAAPGAGAGSGRATPGRREDRADLPAVQESFGVVPARLRRAVRRHGGRRRGRGRPSTGCCQPRVEAEVAFVLGADLPDEQVTVADVIRAVDYVLPAIEIVDSRIAGWDISIVDTVADNASSGLFVLGTTPAPARRRGPAAVRDGAGARRASRSRSGAGAACLGNPLHAVQWLAAHPGPRRRPAARRATWCCPARSARWCRSRPGAAYEARISGLGSVADRASATGGDAVTQPVWRCIGSGNIGTDLMIKVLRLSAVAADGGDGRHRPGLRRAGAGRAGSAWPPPPRASTGWSAMPEFADVELVFDATSAGAHRRNDEVLRAHGQHGGRPDPGRDRAVRGAAGQPGRAPATSRNVNMVTCGGQATVPIVAAVGRGDPGGVRRDRRVDRVAVGRARAPGPTSTSSPRPRRGPSRWSAAPSAARRSSC